MTNNGNKKAGNIQNRLDKKPLRFNDPVVHDPNFLRALVNAVKNGSLPKWKADELRRAFVLDCKEDE